MLGVEPELESDQKRNLLSHLATCTYVKSYVHPDIYRGNQGIFRLTSVRQSQTVLIRAANTVLVKIQFHRPVS